MKGEKSDVFCLFKVFYGERQLLGAERLYTTHEAIIPILETLLVIYVSNATYIFRDTHQLLLRGSLT
jgi:hypothetical protein